MKRREFIAFAATAPFLTNCKSIYNPEGIQGDREVIEGHKKLNSNQYGKTYIVKPYSTLDLNGFTLYGNARNGKAPVKIAARLQNNASIINGTIDSYINAISTDSQLPRNHLETLKGVGKAEARQQGEDKRILSNSGQKIIKIKTRDIIRSGIYIQAFCKDVLIENCNMDGTGLMHIYIDHGSAYHIIKNNTFGSCGYNHQTGREAIAIDGCVNVTVSGNKFIKTQKLRAISVYTNWGENGITREISRDHNITENNFIGASRGISLASRHMRRVAGVRKVDYAMNCIVSKNTFIGSKMPIEDLGELNYIYENIYKKAPKIGA